MCAPPPSRDRARAQAQGADAQVTTTFFEVAFLPMATTVVPSGALDELRCPREISRAVLTRGGRPLSEHPKTSRDSSMRGSRRSDAGPASSTRFTVAKAPLETLYVRGSDDSSSRPSRKDNDLDLRGPRGDTDAPQILHSHDKGKTVVAKKPFVDRSDVASVNALPIKLVSKSVSSGEHSC